MYPYRVAGHNDLFAIKLLPLGIEAPEGVMIVSLLWVLCFPIAVVMAAAVAEWALGAGAKHAVLIVPGRVISFDAARRRLAHTPHRAPPPAVARSGRVIMLHEARRQRSNLAGESAFRLPRDR
jgi:hypothetical protein